MKSKIEYWTMWSDGTCCEKKKTLKGAKRSAHACEKRGGQGHAIYAVRLVVKSGD